MKEEYEDQPVIITESKYEQLRRFTTRACEQMNQGFYNKAQVMALIVIAEMMIDLAETVQNRP